MANLDDYLCFSVRHLMKKVDRNLSEKFEEYGITIPQSFILHSLLGENGITLKEIGTRTLIDSSSMTVLVDKLEHEKLVERRLDPQDRRAIRVFITPEGLEVAEKITGIAREFNVKLYDLIGQGNQKEFVHGVNNIIKGLE